MTRDPIYVTDKCLECGVKLTPSKRGHPRRFCAPAHAKTFNNIAAKRGSHAYHLVYAMRSEREKSKQLGLWNELCRLHIAWRDEDQKSGRTMPAYKPPEMTLADIAACERCIPSTNLYIREREPT